MSSAPGRPQHHIQAQGVTRRAEHIQSWTRTRQHLRKALGELYMAFGAQARFAQGEGARRAVLTGTGGTATEASAQKNKGGFTAIKSGAKGGGRSFFLVKTAHPINSAAR